MSSRHPRPNIRKAYLQRHQTEFDKWTDAEIADYRVKMVREGKFNLSELSRRMEIGCVLVNLYFHLAVRDSKPPASQALKLRDILRDKWNVAQLVSCVDRNRKSDEILEDLKPIIERYTTRTQKMYPPEWR